MCNTELTNYLPIPVLYLRCLFRALRNILTFQSVSFCFPLPTWIIPTLCFNAKYICLLYQSPPTSYANELTWYLLKACDSETIHFPWDEKNTLYWKGKKKATPWDHYLTKTQKWLSLELYSLSKLKAPPATLWGGQRRQACAQGCNRQIILGCVITDAKERGYCHATLFK